MIPAKFVAAVVEYCGRQDVLQPSIQYYRRSALYMLSELISPLKSCASAQVCYSSNFRGYHYWKCMFGLHLDYR